MEVRIGVDAQDWTAALETLRPDRHDLYFGPAFHDVHAAHGDGMPHASIVRDGSALLIVPGLRRAIDGAATRWDLQTCRTGCAGPLASDTADAPFLERAWGAWAQEMARHGAVAAFFRLHPIVATERWLPRCADVRLDRSAVVIDLEGGKERAWASAASSHHNMVRKARRLGCEVSWNEGHSAFERLYLEAMRRVDSEPELRFGQPFFEGLWQLAGVEVAVVRTAGDVVAGAVFVWSAACGHYLLAARRADAGNHVSNLLLDAATDRAIARGIPLLYLGGGRTPRPDDSLLRFKRSAGTRLVDYRVALVPIDDEARQQLIGDWTALAGRAPSWLLGYRQPLAAQLVSHDD